MQTTAQDRETASDATEAFVEYQKNEYKYIAEAHFKTIDSISAFFRYFLLIAAVPWSVVAAVLARDQAMESGWLAAGRPLSLVFALVGLLGAMMFLYVIQLRFDALLYARQVNLIRKFFYDGASLPFANKKLLRELPMGRSGPRYVELYFVPVVGAFLLVNSSYLEIAQILWSEPAARWQNSATWGDLFLSNYLVFLVSALLHAGFYVFMGKHRQHGYLRGRDILVDIDGVLNLHRVQFCDLFNAQNNTALVADSIRTLPVHRTQNLGVTKATERQVFREVKYWTHMPVMPHCAESLSDIRNLGIRVTIVTKRPWPRHGLSRDAWLKKEEEWRQQVRGWLRANPYPGRWIDWLRLMINHTPPIRVITRAWLRQNGIPYDRLIIEGDTTTSWWRRWFLRNRFSVAYQGRAQYCVEDDPIIAAKMAFTSDTVFLVDHPYNDGAAVDPDLAGQDGFEWRFPPNVIRVTNWHSIYQAIRHLHS